MNGLAALALLINPLLPSGADPWITSRNGFYYYMNTTGSSLVIWKTKSISALAAAQKKTVWRPPESGPYSHGIWAPELHFLRGKWYIYFAADAGENDTHRNWVLENASADPLLGDWIFKGQLTDKTNKWAIDPSVFEEGGKLYALWSGWSGNKNGTQSIYIAAMESPWRIKSKRVRLSSPEYAWERYGTEAAPFV